MPTRCFSIGVKGRVTKFRAGKPPRLCAINERHLHYYTQITDTEVSAMNQGQSSTQGSVYNPMDVVFVLLPWSRCQQPTLQSSQYELEEDVTAIRARRFSKNNGRARRLE
jgi:hypothetical protein